MTATGRALEPDEDGPLLRAVAEALDQFTGPVGVAVSGGGDSVALLHLIWRVCGHRGVAVSVVTVDHGLRPEAAAEAAEVAALCTGLSVPHRTVVWKHGPVAGNLMDAARRARMALIAGWARERGIGHVALGHTADDQAETFLMALSRASGLDGLVGMPAQWQAEGVGWTRPLLRATREDLRAYLRRHGIGWAEDPTNDDLRYERVRARAAMAALAPLGIDAGRIGVSIDNLRMAQEVVAEALRAEGAHVSEMAGALRIDRAGFGQMPREMRRRVLVSGIGWLSGETAPPRGEAQVMLLDAAEAGLDRTLGGCRMIARGNHLWLLREARAVSGIEAVPGSVWDGRWLVTGPGAEPGVTLAALGPAGLRQCPDWRATKLPREVLAVTPGVWRGDVLVAAPLAGMANGWVARVRPAFGL
ncbi:MAG: tRNA lysidine(34) synthetase TilS [Gemmobacter sp.]